MIRFSAFLVVVAVGLLVAGVVTSKLLLVYIAIGVSGVALLALGIGAVVKRRELFGTPQTAASDVATAPSPDPVPGLQAPRPAAGPAWPPASPGRPGSVWESAVPPTGMFPAVRPAAPPPGPRTPEPPVPAVMRSSADVPASAVWEWPEDSVQAQPATGKPTAIDRAIVVDEPTAIDLPVVTDRRIGTSQPRAKEFWTRPDLPAHEAPAPNAPAPVESAPVESAPVESAHDAPPPVEPEPAPADAHPAEPEPAALESEPAEPPPAEPEAVTPEPEAVSEVASATPEAKSGPDAQTLVTVVPGVPRYHNATCILIRFMGENDLDKMAIAAARDAGCTPCRACLPD